VGDINGMMVLLEGLKKKKEKTRITMIKEKTISFSFN